jgi:uncharacterized integral membrane protein
MERELQYKKEDEYIRAKKKLDKLKGFYWHLIWYIIANTILIILIIANSDANETIWEFGTFATAFIWGIGLFFHFMGVYGPGLIFGKNWEERKVKEYMDKEKKRWN